MEKAKQFSQTGLETIIVIAIVIVVNILGQYYYTRVDLTEDQRFTLRDSSRSIVANLPDIVRIKAYVSEDLPTQARPALDSLNDLLEEYSASASSRLTIQTIDPADLDEDEIEALGMRGITEKVYTIQASDEYGEKRAYFDLEITYLDKYEVITAIPEVPNLEYEITSAIVKLTSEERPTIGFLTGHGEMDRETGFPALSEGIGDLVAVRDIDLAQGDQVPDGVDVLVVVQPAAPMSERHQYVIDQFVMRGGKLVVLTNGIATDQMQNQATIAQMPLASVLASYGVKVNSDLVCDPVSGLYVQLQGQGGMPQLIRYPFFAPAFRHAGGFPSGSPATRGIAALAFPNVSSLDLLYDKLDDIEIMELIKTGTDSFSYPAPVDLSPQQDFTAMAGGDITHQLVGVQLNGTFTSAFANSPVPAFDLPPDAIEGAIPEIDTEPALSTSAETSIVVIGCGEFINEQFNGFLQQMAMFNRYVPNNSVFFFNMIESLSVGDALIDIRSRAITPRPLDPDLTPSDKNMLKFWGYIFVPVLIIFLGVGRFYVKGQRKRIMAAIHEAEMKESRKSGGDE